jgi:cobalt-zinc-cadmium efflux system outer membrane protein
LEYHQKRISLISWRDNLECIWIWCDKKMNRFVLIVQFFAFSLCFTLQAYASPALNVFVRQVLANNPAIQAAESNVEAAKSRDFASGQPLYNPELTAQRQNAIDNISSLGINQTIDWANKRGARKQIGAANVLVAQAQLAEVRQQLIAEILSALAKHQAQEKVVFLAKERTSLLQQLVELTKKRYKNGDIGRVDLDLAQLAFAEAVAQQADAEVSANEALQILRASTGFSRMAWPHLSSILPTPSLNSMDVDRLLTQLPAVLILNKQYQAALASIKLTESERYPDPTIGLQGGRDTTQDESKKLIGVSFTIPLFVRNTHRGEVDAANYDAIEAERKRADIIRQAKAGIESSTERYRIYYRAIQEWQQVSGKPLDSGMVLIKRLWQDGEINTTDYLVQIKQRVDSQIAGVELKERAWKAWIASLRASGLVESWLQISPLPSGDQ